MTGDSCDVPDKESEIMIPADGALRIEIPPCAAANKQFTDELTGLPACKAEISSSNTLVLDFAPHERLYFDESANNIVVFDTEAVDPFSTNPPFPPDVGFLVVDAHSNDPLKSGTVRISGDCPEAQ
jgi:hypothetical protein